MMHASMSLPAPNQKSSVHMPEPAADLTVKSLNDHMSAAPIATGTAWLKESFFLMSNDTRNEPAMRRNMPAYAAAPKDSESRTAAPNMVNTGDSMASGTTLEMSSIFIALK